MAEKNTRTSILDNLRQHHLPLKYAVGFTASAFDLLHAGHILMLEEAKSICDHLICAIQTDPTIDRPQKNKPIQSMEERLIQLRAVKYVDEVVIYRTEQDLEKLLTSLSINVRIIGEDYRGKAFTGQTICAHRHIDIYYNSRGHTYSTTELRNRIKNA